jgi:hypothetical protein
MGAESGMTAETMYTTLIAMSLFDTLRYKLKRQRADDDETEYV